jgi:transcriptional regulator GlxA family with amidase domain
MPQVEIAIVLYPGAQLACVHGLTDLFSVANRFIRANDAFPPLAVSHWRCDEAGSQPTCIFSTSAIADPQLKVVILPPSLEGIPEAEIAQRFAPWLVAHHRAGAVMASICAGAFLLARTKLLDGRTITTHWAHADSFRQSFPAIRLDTDKLVIDDGDLMTAGGVMAWTDLGLKLVDRFLGPSIMGQTARLMLIDPPGREQRYYSAFSPRLSHGDAPILKVQHRLQSTGAKQVSLTALAAEAGLEERTFLRRFRRATGMTATDYCQRLRVGKACEQLQATTQPIATIAWLAGYGDVAAFRKVFMRIVGLTPGDYRKRFRAQSAS